MATKTVHIEGIGEVRLQKYRKSRSLRISIDPHGAVRVSLPYWAPYASAIAFAMQKRDWIAQNIRGKRTKLLRDGQAIGKTYQLRILPKPGAAAVAARVGASTVTVHHPVHVTALDREVQKHARNAIHRALKREAEAILPDRLYTLASAYGFDYSSISIKRLKSRWGSCSSKNDIVLNMFLVQLPWELIDYVILHELTHTIHPHHQSEFWSGMQKYMPDARARRKRLKQFEPAILTA